MPEPRFLKDPYRLGGDGTPATTTGDDHLADLILQVLFTSPGERVNLPEFGAGVRRLLFEPNGDALRAGAKFLITTSLNRWLGDRIDVGQVQVTGGDDPEGSVTVEIAYTVKATRQNQVLQVQV
jgi:phage baseplate assembly protein W